MLLLHICTSSAFIRRMSFLLIAALAISTSAFSCPLGYINYSLNNQCYTTTIDALNWYDARDRCEALGGVLATIDSLDVNNFIRSSFNASNIWLGYNDQKIEGVFEWQSGEVSGFTNWMRDQPDNFNNQDCAEMTPNGKWVDQNCSLYRVGVCQQSPTSLICPDGYTLSLYDSNCYKRAPTPSTWFDAKTNCQSEGGNLAVVTSMTLNTLIFDTFGGGDYRLWLGLNDIANEGVFVWDSGDTSSFRNWDSTQPDSSGGNENCVQMWFEGKWNDAWCYRVSESVFGHYGLCETFSVLAPSPTSTPSIPPTSSPTPLTKYSYAVLFNNQSVPLSDSNEALMTSFFKQQETYSPYSRSVSPLVVSAVDDTPISNTSMLIKWRPVYLTPSSKSFGEWEGSTIIPFGKFVCWLVSLSMEDIVGFVVYDFASSNYFVYRVYLTVDGILTIAPIPSLTIPDLRHYVSGISDQFFYRVDPEFRD